MTEHARSGPYLDLLARAEASADVIGLVLTGSHARGLAGPDSDYDVLVVVPDERLWKPTSRSAELDEIVCTTDQLADTSDEWQRYAFRGAEILLDRTDGELAALVSAQATLTETEAATWAREGLDGYVNLIYRAAKNRRAAEPVLARLEEMESVSWLLTALFALHGRVRPYNKYLRWELRTFPLGEPWNADTFPERLADDPAGLFPELERLARKAGHGDVLDAWGTELELLRRP
ncbi:nucleotidyltransferase domain-containing protein [Micromonospora sp. DT227]|uniref:nucleotidyltransferase domain-containing protein n=1 Tax=Micromonospora sp. DT227 TaxID=3393433 RepID=UPI003CF4D831